MSVIDVWARQPTERFLAQPFFDSLKKWIGMDVSEIPVEFLLQSMDEAGVDLALLAAWYAPEGDLISNDEVLALVQQYPQRFAGLASADIRNPVQALGELRKYVGEHGFKGLRIVQWLWELPCSHALC